MFKKNLKRVITIALTACMVMGSAAGCGKDEDSTKPTPTPTTAADTENKDNQGSTDNSGTTNPDPTAEPDAPEIVVEDFGDAEYVYKDSVGVLSANWNPHTYETSDERYPIDYLTTGLYTFIFNDELNPVEGKDPYAGYVIVPEMAAAMPVDVTEKIKAEHPEFNIPADATEGYAYVIDLNPLAKWEDGTPINADTYVYSMKQLFDPVMKNFRATDYMDQDFVIANAKAYYNSGQVVATANSTDGATMTYQVADLVKGADGVYTTPDGVPVYFGLNEKYAWMGGANALSAYYGAGYIPDEGCWAVLSAAADADGYVPVTDETMDALYSFTGSSIWGNEPKEQLGYYMTFDVTYPEVAWENVGIMKTGDYQITLVLGKSLAGFTLLYNLSGNWLVYEPYYEKCKTQIGETGAWSSTYNTSLETTMSYGPYKMTVFQTDKAMRFERNENWFGYTDGKHIYQDPVDGLIYPMYQTTAIDTQVVAESATNKLMFLKGQLMGYGLQAEDMEQYRDSEYCYVTPDETIFFFIFNGHISAIQEREAAADFDKATTDLETMTLQSFRKAVAVTYDKEALCTAISPARSGGYGLIGNNYIYDPETGAKYRDSEQAKKALCEFYSVDVSKFASLDEAVDSITGYDEVAAKALYKQAFDEAIAAGYITDADGDGKSDQTVTITYSASVINDFMTKTVDYLNKQMTAVTAGTPFEGKILFQLSAALGDPGWSDNLKAGLTDTVLGGWSGSALNPFSLTDLYTNPDRQYDAQWFNASTVNVTLDVNTAGIDNPAKVETVTMTLKQWSDALNGTAIEIDGKTYNFGDGIADVDTRLTILAKIESTVLMTYNYIPMLQNAGMSLLSQQVYYVIEDYNVILGRGGITYMKYNYDEKAWAEYVNSQPDGTLSY